MYYSNSYLEVFCVSIAPLIHIFSFLLIVLCQIIYTFLVKSREHNFFLRKGKKKKATTPNLGVSQKILFFFFSFKYVFLTHVF